MGVEMQERMRERIFAGRLHCHVNLEEGVEEEVPEVSS
jgi:hypothetical protein